MKQTKRLLAILLALAMTLALALPALAAEEDDLAYPIFTKELPVITVAQTGGSVVLEAEVKLPEGVEAELYYQWYATDWQAGTSFAEDVEYYPIEEETDARLEDSLVLDVVGSYPSPLMSRIYRLEAYYFTDSMRIYTWCDTKVFCNYSFGDAWRAVYNLVGPGVLPELVLRAMGLPLALMIYTGGKFFANLYRWIYAV